MLNQTMQLTNRSVLLAVLLFAVQPAARWMPSAHAAETTQAIKVGDQAPEFELPVQGRDAYLSLSQLVQDGPVVVIVLRGFPGYNCPQCNRQVSSLRNRATSLGRALGGGDNRVVLIYPGEESGLEMRGGQFLGSRALPSPLVMLRDPNMQMASSWGLRWPVRRETAYPAAYLIGPGRRVKWAKVSDSHAGRATVEEILRAINKL